MLYYIIENIQMLLEPGKKNLKNGKYIHAILDLSSFIDATKLRLQAYRAC